MNIQAIRQQVSSNNNNLNMATIYLQRSKRMITWHHSKTWHKQTTGVPPVQSPTQVGLDRVPEITQRSYLWRVTGVPIGTKYYNFTCHYNYAQRPYHISQTARPTGLMFPLWACTVDVGSGLTLGSQRSHRHPWTRVAIRLSSNIPCISLLFL